MREGLWSEGFGLIYELERTMAEKADPTHWICDQRHIGAVGKLHVVTRGAYREMGI